MRRTWSHAATAAVVFAAIAGDARAQQPSRTPEEAAVVVVGTVRDVFRNVLPDRAGMLVQVDVARSELGRAADRRSPIPAPGDPVYVHVTPPARGNADEAAVPTRGATVRVSLYPREGGGWDGSFADPTGSPAGSPPVATDAPGADGDRVLKALGIKADALDVNGRMVLRITEVVAGGPAQKAGFEKGDIVIGANGSGFASLPQFAEILAKGGRKAQLTVLNVRNKEQATVDVDLGDVVATRPRPAPTPAPAPDAPGRTLGVDVEPVRLGLRTALKVRAVRPEGPAKAAGIEVDDVLVAAGGTPLSDADALQKAIDEAGDAITITVRDVRTGKDVPVKVALGPAAKPEPTPAPPSEPEPAPTPGAGATSRGFGLTVKPGTADLLPVVKVAAVAPGSPAAKAGLEVGDAIVGVDDRVVFAPDLFEEALKGVGRTFTLTVLDVKTGKKSSVSVDLGR